ncbi:MAG: hypothetical protein H7274_20220 [Rhodoferax sp.]|nr:hypothetical protein [Rhodoferax sp.]
MLITIPEPKRFYCASDENHFFSWLQSIPAVKSVNGKQHGLDLIFDVPIDRVSFYELVGLMTRYRLEMRALRPLCEGHTDQWFTDEKNYWYKAIFY